MNFEQLLLDYGVPFAQPGEKHYREGWLNIDCPFCEGKLNKPLGYNTDDNYFHCWRCGSHFILHVVSAITGLPSSKSKELIRQYNGYYSKRTKDAKVIIRKKAFKFPSNTEPLNKAHEKYLLKRKFDPDEIVKKWGVLGTGPISHLSTGTGKGKKMIKFKNRIIIPIFWNDAVVSFQTRSISDEIELKYITCPKDRELIFHKEILYGKQSSWNEMGIWVEGIFDVWRLGFPSFATFGTSYTMEQLRLIAKTFKIVAVCFDNEKEAQEKARQAIAELIFRGVNSFNVVVEDDPASMKQEEADYLVKQLILKKSWKIKK